MTRHMIGREREETNIRMSNTPLNFPIRIEGSDTGGVHKNLMKQRRHSCFISNAEGSSHKLFWWMLRRKAEEFAVCF